MSPPPLHQRALSAFLRLFFRLLYHPFAWTYDAVAAIVSTGLWRKWVLSVLPYLKGPNVLELGHGPGHLQKALHEKGIRSCGLDASKQMGRLAFSGIQRAGYQPLLVNGYAQFLPFANGSFQQVAATFPTEYIADPKTIAEIYRVLVPGGELIILPTAWITGKGILRRLAAGLFRVTGQAPDWQDTAVMTLEYFEKAGFSIRTEFIERSDSRLALIRAQKQGE